MNQELFTDLQQALLWVFGDYILWWLAALIASAILAGAGWFFLSLSQGLTRGSREIL